MACAKRLLAGFILLIGSIVYMAVNIAMTRYVNGLHMDAEDNLLARKAATQMRLLAAGRQCPDRLRRAGFALMSFDTVRQFGVSLFASAGVAGIIAGFAARPVLSNLIAGMQLALTQPIRLDDVVVVEGEWGRIEEFTVDLCRGADLGFAAADRALVLFSGDAVPQLVLFGLQDHRHGLSSTPIIPCRWRAIRDKAIELIKASPLWDGDAAGLVVTDAKESTMELRAIMSASDSSKAWDLRCAVREGLIDFIQTEFPDALPRTRAEFAASVPAGPAGPERAGPQQGG